MKIQNSFFPLALLVAALAALPGCSLIDWVKTKTCSDCAGHGEAVIKVNGRALLDCDQFAEKLDTIYQSRQGIQEIIAQMPEDKQLEVFDQIAEGLVAERLIADDVKERNLVNKAMAEQAHKQLDVDLAIRAFQEDLTAEIQGLMNKIEDAEAISFYESNRSKMPVFQQPPFLVNSAQVKASADSKDKTKKVAPQYAEFDKVRELVKQVMMQDRMPAIYTEKMNALKAKHKVEVNKECFKKFVVSNNSAGMTDISELAVEETVSAPQSATRTV
jgi:hypothetical protein